MKKMMLIPAILISFASATIAQKVPADSISCNKNFLISSEHFSKQEFAAAMASWRFVFTNCPNHSRQIYQQGEVMFAKFISSENNLSNKTKFVDTLMLIYDQEIKYFKEEGRVLGKKGVSLYKFAPERINETPAILEKSVSIEGSRSKAEVLQTYFQVTADLYQKGKLSMEAVPNVYLKVLELIEVNLGSPDRKSYEVALQKVDSVFSSAISCDELIKLYSPLLKESPENKELLKKVVLLSGKKQCYDDPLMLEVSQKLHSMEPSGQTALNLAHVYAARKENTKAAGYFNDATELESNTHKKADIFLESANFYWKQLDSYAQARTQALRAISLDPTWGKPWMFLGDLYISDVASCNDSFKGASVYWVATDKYLKAKSVDPSSAAEADQKILINNSHFPNQKDILAKGMKVGDNYTVKCWINEVTTIRSK